MNLGRARKDDYQEHRNETLGAYRVVTDRRGWRCRTVVIASGASNLTTRRRNSNFIDGVGAEGDDLSDNIVVFLKTGRRARSLIGEPAPWRSSVDFGHFTTWSLSVRGLPVLRRRCCLPASGQRVLLIDRQPYGSDTLSTHALMRGGVLQLHRWGLLDRVIAAGTPPVRRTIFRYGDEEVAIDIKHQDGVDALYAPRRTVIDPILVDAAREGGAEVRHGVALMPWRGRLRGGSGAL